MKAKYDVYIRKDLQDFLDAEDNRSGLINELLAKHYEKIAKKQEDLATVGIRSSVKHEVKDNKVVSTVVPNKGDVSNFKHKIKTSYQAAEAVKELWPEAKVIVPLLGECLRHHVDKSICGCEV